MMAGLSTEDQGEEYKDQDLNEPPNEGLEHVSARPSTENQKVPTGSGQVV